MLSSQEYSEFPSSSVVSGAFSPSTNNVGRNTSNVSVVSNVNHTVSISSSPLLMTQSGLSSPHSFVIVTDDSVPPVLSETTLPAYLHLYFKFVVSDIPSTLTDRFIESPTVYSHSPPVHESVCSLPSTYLVMVMSSVSAAFTFTFPLINAAVRTTNKATSQIPACL